MFQVGVEKWIYVKWELIDDIVGGHMWKWGGRQIMGLHVVTESDEKATKAESDFKNFVEGLQKQYESESKKKDLPKQ